MKRRKGETCSASQTQLTCKNKHESFCLSPSLEVQFLVILLPGSNTPRPQRCHKPLQPQYIKFKIRVLHTFLLAILKLWSYLQNHSAPLLQDFAHTTFVAATLELSWLHTLVWCCASKAPTKPGAFRKCSTETFQQLAKGWLGPCRIDIDLELISSGETHTCLWAQWIHMVLTDSGRLSITLNHQEYECPSTPRYCTDPAVTHFTELVLAHIPG